MRPTERESANGVPKLVDRALGDPTDPRGSPPPAPRRERRSTVLVASSLNALAGVWLVVAPFVLDYGAGEPRWNDVVFGAIVTVLALARVAAYRASELSWLSAFVGAWLFAAAFWLDAGSTAARNDIVLGLCVFVLGLVSATASDDRSRRRRS